MTTTSVRERANGTETNTPRGVFIASELLARTDDEHREQLDGMTRYEQAGYACTVLPHAQPKEITEWLNEHGANIPPTGAANIRNQVSKWRRENGRDTSGKLVVLTPERLAELDAEHTPEPVTINVREQLTNSEQPQVSDHEQSTADAMPAEMAPEPVSAPPALLLASPAPTPTEPVCEPDPEPSPPPAREQFAPAPAALPSHPHVGATDPTTGLERDPEGWHNPKKLLNVFYGVVAALALWGQSDGMMKWLGLVDSGLSEVAQRLLALGAGAVIELLAVVLLAFADWRTIYKFERAYAVRAFAIAVAGFVVYLNWEAHGEATGWFFAGVSATGFVVWLLNSAAKRRDALRARRRLPAAPQSYPLVQWMRHPVITWRAREAAKENPALGLYGSLAHIANADRAEAKREALDGLIRQWLATRYGTTPVGKLKTEIEATRYDLNKVANDLASSANNEHMAAAIVSELLAVTTTNTATREHEQSASA